MSGQQSDHDEVPVVVDLYGIKVTSSPADLGEAPAASWRDVREQLSRHFFRFITAPSRLIVEILEGATRLVRGISRLPASVSRRLEHSHREADQQEDIKQQMIPRHPKTAIGVSDADLEHRTIAAEAIVSRITKILQHYRDLGTEAYVTLGAHGRLVVVVGLPKGSDSSVLEVLEQLEEQTAIDGPTKHIG